MDVSDRPGTSAARIGVEGVTDAGVEPLGGGGAGSGRTTGVPDPTEGSRAEGVEIGISELGRESPAVIGGTAGCVAVVPACGGNPAEPPCVEGKPVSGSVRGSLLKIGAVVVGDIGSPEGGVADPPSGGVCTGERAGDEPGPPGVAVAGDGRPGCSAVLRGVAVRGFPPDAVRGVAPPLGVPPPVAGAGLFPTSMGIWSVLCASEDG